MIRAMTHHDVPTVAVLGEKFHAQAGWSDVFDYNVADCATSLTELLNSDVFIALVAEHEGRIVGMAAGVVSPVYFNRAHISGEELFWWVDDVAPQMTGIRLLKALETAAKGKGAASFQMKSIAKLNGDRMARLYERQGYRPSERSFIKRV